MMSLTLIFVAVLLTGVFEVHSRVVGNFVLQEALEQWTFAENKGEEGMEGVEKLERSAERRLRSFFYCGSSSLRLESRNKSCLGKVETSVQTEISVKKYEPEPGMRLWAAVREGNREEQGGSSIQKRNEP